LTHSIQWNTLKFNLKRDNGEQAHVTGRFQTGGLGATGLISRFRVESSAMTAAARGSSGGGFGGSAGTGGASGSSTGESDVGLLVDRELRQIEKDFAIGLTAVQVVDIFTQRGIRFSEATFRKYVQLGLLPRSRRVGRKGKHQGSLGLYPPTTVRRINAIKQLMSDNYTIEDIQKQFLRYRDELEAIERGFATVLNGFEEDLKAPHFDAEMRKNLKRDLAEARRGADELLKRLEGLEKRISAPPPGEGGRGPGRPGGAEDLL
jgi:DNA-binding transcriptional MerR regulator